MQSRTHPNSAFPARRCQAAPLADLEGSKGLVCCTLVFAYSAVPGVLEMV